MQTSVIKELLLYRYRFLVGYGILVFLSIGLTVWQLDSVPPGYSALEKQSAVISDAISHESTSFLNAPYHFMQKVTMAVFGPTPWGIRLPSVFAALAFIAAAYFLLRRWYGESTAVIGAILVVSSVYLLIRGRSGDPTILYYLWPVLLLLSATYASMQGRQWRLWVWVFALVAGLSLYTPYLGILALIVATAAAASRTGRILIADIGGPVLSLSIVTVLALAAPLIYSFYNEPAQLASYVGMSTNGTTALANERLGELWTTITGAGSGATFTPALSIPAIIFMLYGAVHALRNVARPRYVVTILWLLVGTTLYLSIESVPIAMLFLPMALLVIIGLHRFINRWYELFPRNPYARVVAIVPIALLVAVIVQFSFQRYFYVLPYSSDVRAVYDSDTLLLKRHLDSKAQINGLSVVVSPEQLPFARLFENRLVRVVAPDNGRLSYDTGRIIISNEAYQGLPLPDKAALDGREPALIVDGRPGDDAVRFREY